MTKLICNKCMTGNPCSLDFTGTATAAKGCPFTGTNIAEWKTEDSDRKEPEQKPVTDCNQLPDWCKVWEWVYSIPAQKYDKIIAIQDFRVVTREMKYTDDYINDGNVVQARLRPYNAEEMKALVGKVITHLPTGDVSFVTGFCNRTEKIYSGVNCFNAETLLKDFTINNAPCGVLEHMENWEWVE